MHKKVELEIVALSHSVTQSQNYAVVLGEKFGGKNRRLPIVIGSFEAQAIAVALERMVPNRPLTHDLFRNTLDIFEIELQEVLINQLTDGVFYSRLICVRKGEVHEIDSRTSDAIAMAVRFSCPIYTYEFILEEAGVYISDNEEEPKKGKKSKENNLSNYSIKELESLLNDFLADENYEKAATVRDEINKRKEGES